MKLLAIDPARLTGYACEKNSGTFDCKPKGVQSAAFKLVIFKRKITDLIKDHSIDIVVYEKPSGAHFSGVRSHANFEGVLLSVCEELNIMHREVTGSEVKAFAKKHSKYVGKMDKIAMFETAIEFLNKDTVDDNHADALWIYAYAMATYF